MTLKVIGAGFGRTGTASMKQALELLGFGPCHHMGEVLSSPEQKELWRSVASGMKPNWDVLLAGYHSTVDWPAAYFWRELSEYYPDAKILLTTRSSESWYASMVKTIFKIVKETTDPASIGVKLIGERVFGGNLDDRDHVIAMYEKNIADVQGAFSEDRLLSYNIGDGWEPLCEFLGKPVPDVAYPRSNSTEEFTEARVK
ncbi:MAG: sulfotransferase family protein [Gammaproteobacteria bacterium]|nr:sulfotransferase family protein [Gammaproteobacteria bacterium]